MGFFVSGPYPPEPHPQPLKKKAGPEGPAFYFSNSFPPHSPVNTGCRFSKKAFWPS
jgi:hypothetical protein